MSMVGDFVRENEARFLCGKLIEKIKKYPEAAKALKELGIEQLDALPNTPNWTYQYYRLFRG